MKICRRFHQLSKLKGVLNIYKMKKKYLFCTRMRVYLTEIPIIILFSIACYYNQYSEELTKLYPLLIFLGAAFLFILVYFFRVISLSFEEVKYHGFYSSKDHADINEGKELIFTLEKGRKLRIELFGNDGKAPELDWINSDGDYKPLDIFLFRGKALCGKKRFISILKYFGVDEEDAIALFEKESFSGEYEYVSLTSNVSKEKTVVKLKMKETV